MSELIESILHFIIEHQDAFGEGILKLAGSVIAGYIVFRIKTIWRWIRARSKRKSAAQHKAAHHAQTRKVRPPKFQAEQVGQNLVLSSGPINKPIKSELTFKIENIGGHADDVTIVNSHTTDIVRLGRMRQGASKTFTLNLMKPRFSSAIPGSLSFFIQCDDSEGEPVQPNIHGSIQEDRKFHLE